MAEIMHVDNINALNVVILPILNGTAPFTNVEHVEKQHQDTHHELVMDISMMMESADIMTLMANSLPIYRIFDEQEWLSRRICGRIIIVEESSDEEDTVVEDNDP
jgi:hypothetical protein